MRVSKHTQATFESRVGTQWGLLNSTTSLLYGWLGPRVNAGVQRKCSAIKSQLVLHPECLHQPSTKARLINGRYVNQIVVPCVCALMSPNHPVMSALLMDPSQVLLQHYDKFQWQTEGNIRRGKRRATLRHVQWRSFVLEMHPVTITNIQGCL